MSKFRLFLYIAFSSRATLKLEPMSTEVVYSTQLLATIKKYMVTFLTEEQKRKIHMDLSTRTLHTREERVRHVSDIKGSLQEARDKVNSGIRPKCNAQLVERRGKNGSFLGCSNFPRCRFTR